MPTYRSFDLPRGREVPEVFEGRWLDGTPASIALSEPTLVVAVKTMCDGCRLFVESDLIEFSGLGIMIVSATEDSRGEWSSSRHPILVAPRVLEQLDIRWPPFYVLIDPTSRRVLTEGVVFAPEQVASEISSHLGT
ncbi:MAG: hypothetical protein HKL86_05370 [Acidimicrobiaceae bacterium]|nr:hypothetical protein [Acidimicrobiaceae bacterium]